MSDDTVIRVEDVSKCFKLYGTAWDRIAEWLSLPWRTTPEESWALRSVSFEVRRGECVGIIGPNGAGKSTLLKILTRAMWPSHGRIEVRGRVLSLIELGAGFNPELTGRQNIEYSARLLGLPPRFASRSLAEVERFAELGEYFDRPVKIYSSGMFVRLAFSLFSTLDPEVFLVDEALAVGDLRFSTKALARIKQMAERGTTLLVVSHDLQLINQLCNRVVWLHSGTLQMDGPPIDVTRAYQQFVVHGSVEAAGAIKADDASTSAKLLPPVGRASEPAEDLFLGRGWYPLEAYAGEVFRWGDGQASLLVPPMQSSRCLRLEIEPGPAVARSPVPVVVRDGHGDILARVHLAGRQVVEIPIEGENSARGRIRLETVVDAAESEYGLSASADQRKLAVRLFRWGWSPSSLLDSVDRLLEWVDEAEDPEVLKELESMRAALSRSGPTTGAPAHITKIVARNGAGTPAVRFATYDALRLDIGVDADGEANGLVFGVQIRDAFDRVLCGSRTDWHGHRTPTLSAGEHLTQSFAISSLTLGTGRYVVTVAIHGKGPSGERMWQWVDGAWTIQVFAPAQARFGGPVDLGLEALPVERHVTDGSPA